MTFDNQLDLYQQVILEHNRHPRNFKKIEDASYKAEGFNPLCGDHLWIYLKVSPEGIIQEVSFQGEGCAISKASASMMTVALKGKEIAFAKKIFTDFHHLVTGELNPEKDAHVLGNLKIFSGICRYPSRVKCASLAWHTMNGALSSVTQISTEIEGGTDL
jgi:nitrogen fixation NifU-like protein